MRYKVASRSSYEDDRKFVREHVLVAEKIIGHKLENGEVVHHIDHDKLNNNPDNLMIFASNADHSAFHKGAQIYNVNGIWKAIQETKTYVCEYCGKSFVPKYDRQYEHVYCSRKCSGLASRKTSHMSKKDPISKEDLYELIISTNGNFRAVGKIFGVSDNAVRKWCKKLGLPTHSSIYRSIIHGALAQLKE